VTNDHRHPSSGRSVLLIPRKPPAGTVRGVERVIVLDEVHNLRDLGGYAADGGELRWRRLFRSDGLHRLGGADLHSVRLLGLRTVLDLRSGPELAERGRFPVADHPVHFHHLPMIDVTWGHDEGPEPGQPDWTFLVRKYVEILEVGAVWVARAFHTLAVPGALPAVFHCAAGKDRTGILAALLLSSLGVADHDVVTDYALTAAAMARMEAWATATDPELAAVLASHPRSHLGAQPEAMAGLLAHIRQGHGSVPAYLTTLGVGEAVLGRLREALVEPAGRRVGAAA
jgi:protein-tyrosine phosphatase